MQNKVSVWVWVRARAHACTGMPKRMEEEVHVHKINFEIIYEKNRQNPNVWLVFEIKL